jgi:hypothetical protein
VHCPGEDALREEASPLRGFTQGEAMSVVAWLHTLGSSGPSIQKMIILYCYFCFHWGLNVDTQPVVNM